MSREFALYDLRVTVEKIEGRSVCSMAVGDYFELTESNKLRIPAGKHFCIYALSAILPLLAAKQRELAANDWLERDALIACPDPDERLIMRLERIEKRILNSDESNMTTREISIAFQTDKTAAQYMALAKLVNEYDFDVVSVYCDAPFHPGYTALMLMTPHIRRARVGVAAVPPSRVHPIDIASQTALLADMASGGVYFGVARGAWLEDHGIREAQPAVQAVREAVEIVRYLLSGATGGYAGQVYKLAEHVRAPYPLPEKKIPAMIGSWGKKLCAVAGELADEVKVGGSANPDMIHVIQGYIAAGEKIAGREPGSVRVVMGAVSVIDEDRDKARQAARKSVALYLPVVAPLDPTLSVEPELMERLREHVNRGEHDTAAGLISDELLDRFALSGNAEDLINHASRLFEAGAGRIEFGTPHGLLKPEPGIRILGEKVIPALRQLWK